VKGQFSHLFDFDPYEHAFRIALERRTAEARDYKQEAEPVFSALAESSRCERWCVRHDDALASYTGNAL
jgi:hypothetical protein